MDTNRATKLPRWIFLGILALLPLAMVAIEFSFTEGFLGLPRFGQTFIERALPFVREHVHDTLAKKNGYDGQFYAQIALDPTLRDPGLIAACDTVSYRAKRIGMPVLAYAIGLGQPYYILQVYSLLNVLFWLDLLYLIVSRFGCTTTRERLLVAAILWNSGVLISVSRALTDLPAMCLSVAALILAERFDERKKLGHQQNYRGNSWLAILIASFACLTKETAVLSVSAYFPRYIKAHWLHCVVIASMMMLPVLAWSIYVRQTVGADPIGLNNFAWPFYGFVEKLYRAWSKTATEFPRIPVLEIIAPWSVLFQVVFLIVHFDWQSRWWRLGIGFGFLAIFIGTFVWETQSAYSRVLLPLAVSFNVILFELKLPEKNFRRWWWLGNIGLLDRAIPGLAIWVIAEWWWNRSRGNAS